LEILFSEISAVGTNEQQQLKHHSKNPVEMPRAGAATWARRFGGWARAQP
jgi:hypothetical protein